MYKVFCNHLTIIFGTSGDCILFMNDHHVDLILQSKDINLLQEKIETNDMNPGIILISSIHPEEEKRKFLMNYYPVTAAGGVVTNPDNDVLFIFRRNIWDLPKGKLDPIESTAECAVREIMEETGVKVSLENLSSPYVTIHLYHENGRYIVKQTLWYRMSTKNRDLLIPQFAEEITEAKWIKRPLIREQVLSNTYPLIADVLLHYDIIQRP